MSEPGRQNPFSEFNQRVKAARDRRSRRSGRGQDRRPVSDYGPAVRIGVDLVAGIIVGVIIGLLLDSWLGTTPWMLLAFFVLGAAAGIMNVMRTAQRLEDEAQAARREKTADREQD